MAAALMHKMMVLTTRESNAARGGAKEGAKAKAKGASGKEEVSIICHCLIPDKRTLLLGMSDGAILLYQLARDPCDDAWQRQGLEDKKPKRFMPTNGHKGGPLARTLTHHPRPFCSKESIANPLTHTHTLRGPAHSTGNVHMIVYLPAYGLFVSGSADRTVKIWDPWVKDVDKACIQTIPDHAGTVLAILPFHEGKMVFTPGTDKKVKLWAPEPGRDMLMYPRFTLVGEVSSFPPLFYSSLYASLAACLQHRYQCSRAHPTGLSLCGGVMCPSLW